MGSIQPAVDFEGAFTDKDLAFWEKTSSPLLIKLFNLASYSPSLQDQYFNFHNATVLPTLGPIPTPEAQWTPHLTHTHSPFEPSWNIQTSTQQIRYAFEPVGRQAGTDSDPFNQSTSLAFVNTLSKSNILKTLDIAWWQHFTSEFYVHESEIEQAKGFFPPDKAPPTCFLAFDLSSTSFSPILKPYLFPHRRALLANKTTTEVVFAAIRKLDSSATRLIPALEKVERFLSAHKQKLAFQEHEKEIFASNLAVAEKEMGVEMLSIDCIAPTQARIKIYAKTHYTSFSNVSQIYTMGGLRSSPEVMEGLKLLKEFWACLFGLEGEWDEKVEQKVAFLFFGFEIMPGKAEIDVKLYVPTWTSSAEKRNIGGGLQKFFKAQGWGVAEKFEQKSECVFSSGDDSVGNGGYTYVSFAYSAAKGPYVTAYYSPNFLP